MAVRDLDLETVQLGLGGIGLGVHTGLTVNIRGGAALFIIPFNPWCEFLQKRSDLVFLAILLHRAGVDGLRAAFAVVAVAVPVGGIRVVLDDDVDRPLHVIEEESYLVVWDEGRCQRHFPGILFPVGDLSRGPVFRLHQLTHQLGKQTQSNNL